MTIPLPAPTEATVLSPATLSRLQACVGEGGWSTDPDRNAAKLVEWRGRWRGATPLLLSPRSTAEVAAIVRVCAETGTALTPQGGNTGLVGGQIPSGEVLLSLENMRAVRDVSATDDVLVIEAGATLAAAHAAAASVGRRFPLSLASEGSATIGGLASTNAGGVGVLRFGMMRDLTLGIEAVLPNGAVLAGLKRLRKDNTGYDLRGLLIGAEGTLGVITAAALELYPRPASRAVAIAGLISPEAALALLTRAQSAAGAGLEAFELVARTGVEFAMRHLPGTREPLESRPPWYVLLEVTSARLDEAAAALEALLADALEHDEIVDAALAQDETQARAFWALREGQSAAQVPEGAAWKHDVSVPVAAVPRFLRKAGEAVLAFAPGVRVVAFGHLGDGNIHYDVLRPEGDDPARLDAEHGARRDAGARLVHDLVDALGGSISAEHGLGAMKTAEALRYKDPVSVAAMRAIRTALDPTRIMNPRVLF